MSEEKDMYFLEGVNIGLRLLCKRDLAGNYSEWLNDEKVCAYNSHHRFVMSEEELCQYIDSIQGRKDMLVFAIDVRENHKHIGNISLQCINYIDSSAEIAFLLGEREYWGKGYASEAARLVINHAIFQLGLKRIYFGTSEKNIGMQRLGEKLHFLREGVRRKALYKDGVFWDIYEYGLLKEEWRDG